MHKYLKTIFFFAGALAGIVALLSIQKLEGYKTIATLLNDQAASAVVRNYGLLALGLVGIVTAMIRLSMADTQQRQDKRSDLFDRFQKSSEMLNSENMAVRQAGLYTLAEIAKEQPDEFYIMVQSLFCGFLRNASTEQKQLCDDLELTLNSYIARTPEWPPMRADMQDAINLFGQLRTAIPNSRQIENRERYKPELSGLFVAGGTFAGVDFSNSTLNQSIFCDTQMSEINFNNCNLNDVNMDRATITDCKMTNCRFGKLYFRWADITDSALTGFENNWVDFTGAVAINFEHSIDGGYGAIPFVALVKYGLSEPQFDDKTQQIYARVEAEEMENQEEMKRIDADHTSQ